MLTDKQKGESQRKANKKIKATRTRSNRGVNYLFDYAFDGGLRCVGRWSGAGRRRRGGAVGARGRIGRNDCGHLFRTGRRRRRLARERRGTHERHRRPAPLVHAPVEAESRGKSMIVTAFGETRHDSITSATTRYRTPRPTRSCAPSSSDGSWPSAPTKWTTPRSSSTPCDAPKPSLPSCCSCFRCGRTPLSRRCGRGLHLCNRNNQSNSPIRTAGESTT